MGTRPKYGGHNFHRQENSKPSNRGQARNVSWTIPHQEVRAQDEHVYQEVQEAVTKLVHRPGPQPALIAPELPTVAQPASNVLPSNASSVAAVAKDFEHIDKVLLENATTLLSSDYHTRIYVITSLMDSLDIPKEITEPVRRNRRKQVKDPEPLNVEGLNKKTVRELTN